MALENWALASKGATIAVTSIQNSIYPASAAIDGIRAVGAGRDSGGAWIAASVPATATVTLAQPIRVQNIKFYAVRDPANDYTEYTDVETTPYPNSAFTVRGYTGSAWVDLANVSGNNLAKNTVSGGDGVFTKLEIYITAGNGTLNEFEVFGEPPAPLPATGLAFDISIVINNLFEYLAANQTIELDKVKGDLTLPDFKKLYKSAAGRVSTIFPNLMLVQKSKASDFSEDVSTVALRLIFEGAIHGSNTDLIVEQADKYAAAVENMLVNIPPDILGAGVLKFIDSINTECESEFDVLRGNKRVKPTAFLQGFQTQITYFLKGESY